MLSIASLTHVYPNGTRALDNVSLEIPPGLYGLLGPNGAGKSTLMRCLATLQVPTAGQIRFGDIDVLAEPRKLRASLGYLPQDFGVYPRVSAFDMLDHLAVLKGLTASGPRRETVEALLQQVNLWDVRKKAIAGFSGGMRQRFGIAQALIGNPTLMIVDDVTDLCSRMAILVDGRIVSAGTPAALIEGLKGKVWTRAVEPDELPGLHKQFELISTRLRGGRTVIHVLSDAAPDPRFEPVNAGLAEVYFSTLHAQRKARGQSANEASRNAVAH